MSLYEENPLTSQEICHERPLCEGFELISDDKGLNNIVTIILNIIIIIIFIINIIIIIIIINIIIIIIIIIIMIFTIIRL